MPKAPRKSLSASLKRSVLMETGYACAIPACRQTPVEIHHIDRNRSNDVFENLIALCPTHHSRVEKKEIDTTAVRGYKRNLGIISGRYADLERRLLNELAGQPAGTQVDFLRDMDFDFLYLLRDGLIDKLPPEIHGRSGNFIMGIFTYCLTDDGAKFVANWERGRDLQVVETADGT